MTELKLLQIGRRRYGVRVRDLGPDTYGQIGGGLIDLSEDNEGEEAAYTIIHEALHGIWEQRKLVSRPTEERAVTELSWGLTHLFRDNPGLLEHIEKLVAKGR